MNQSKAKTVERDNFVLQTSKLISDWHAVPQRFARHRAIGLCVRIPARKTKLTDQISEARIVYALEYTKKSSSFWDTVVFCYKKTFSWEEM